jgi:hypothetical protein
MTAWCASSSIPQSPTSQSTGPSRFSPFLHVAAKLAALGSNLGLCIRLRSSNLRLVRVLAPRVSGALKAFHGSGTAHMAETGSIVTETGSNLAWCAKRTKRSGIEIKPGPFDRGSLM